MPQYDVPSMDYQRAYDEFCPNKTNEEFEEFRKELEATWFDIYIDHLKDFGFVDEGDYDAYTHAGWTYCCDNSMGGEREERWYQQNRDGLRIVVVYGFSRPVQVKRDASRLRMHGRYLVREFGESWEDTPFDKGHFIAHTLGGIIDNGIFAQRTDLNRGHSAEGKIYRAMERYAFDNPGTFVFSRPIYGDGTSHPFYLEYGLLRSDGTWWVETFGNRYTFTPYTGRDCFPAWYIEWLENDAEKWRRGEPRRAKRRERYARERLERLAKLAES